MKKVSTTRIIFLFLFLFIQISFLKETLYASYIKEYSSIKNVECTNVKESYNNIFFDQSVTFSGNGIQRGAEAKKKNIKKESKFNADKIKLLKESFCSNDPQYYLVEIDGAKEGKLYELIDKDGKIIKSETHKYVRIKPSELWNDQGKEKMFVEIRVWQSTQKTELYASRHFYIYKPKDDGKLLNIKECYGRIKEEIPIVCNYNIRNIYNGGRSIRKKYDFWTFTPAKALNLSDLDTIINLEVIYLDDHGCEEKFMKEIKIGDIYEEKPNVGIEDLEDTICPVDYNYKIITDYKVDTILGYGLTWDKQNDIYTFNAVDAVKEPGFEFYKTNNIIVYFRTAENINCVDTVKVVIMPYLKTGFKSDGYCLGDTTLFKDNSIYLGKSTDTLTWEWVFDDYTDTLRIKGFGDEIISGSDTHNGNTMGTYNNLKHIYHNPGVYNAYLQITTPDGCVRKEQKRIVIGDYPNVKISFKGFTLGKETMFKNNSTAQIFDTIKNFYWDFDDDDIPVKSIVTKDKDISYPFKKPGVHHVNMIAETQQGCKTDSTFKVPVFPLIKVSNQEYYLARFDESQQNWLASHTYQESSSGWKHEKISDPYQSRNISGNIWLTATPERHIPNERSWVESPCFDIRTLDFPMLSIDIYQSVEKGRDGAVLEYTLDDGETWKLLSCGIADIDIGMNWYNQKGIVSHPGCSENTTSSGWSANKQKWQTARFPLDMLKTEIISSGGECVRFRVSYAADAGTAEGENIRGFGFDNFMVTERSRIVLMEQFVNYKYDRQLMQEESEWLDDFVKNKQKEVVKIRYHNYLSTGEYDPLFYINTADISARSFEYGTSYNLKTIVDGIHQCNAEIEGGARKKALAYFNLRTLTDKRFDIDVETENKDGKLYVKASITKLVDTLFFDSQATDHDCFVRMAIVQDTFKYAGDEYHDVLIELLPNGVGNVSGIISNELNKGENMLFENTWEPSVTTIGNSFTLVVYVQNKWGLDEVQQTWFKKLQTEDVPQVIKWPLNINELNSQLAGVHPVPVKEKMRIHSSHNFKTPVLWKLSDISGKILKQGQINKGETEQVIDVKAIKTGVYIILFENRDTQYSEKQKIMIVK